MKTRLPVITKIARILLYLSLAVQVACLVLQWTNLTKADGYSALLIGLTNILGVEVYLIVSAVVSPLLFASLFAQQARGQRGACFLTFFILAAVTIWEHSSTSWKELIGLHVDADAELLIGTVAPLIVMLVICIGRRWLAIPAIALVLLMGFYNLTEMDKLLPILTNDAQLMLLLGEFLFDLGLIVGLLGVKKRKPIEEKAVSE